MVITILEYIIENLLIFFLYIGALTVNNSIRKYILYSFIGFIFIFEITNTIYGLYLIVLLNWVSYLPKEIFLFVREPYPFNIILLSLKILFSIILFVKLILSISKNKFMSEFSFYGIVVIIIILSCHTSISFIYEINDIFYLFLILLVQFQKGYFTRMPVNEQ
jgi:hypothetical protein